MDTLVITPTDLAIYGSAFSLGPNPSSEGTTIDAPINSTINIQSFVGGTRKINGADSTDYSKIGFNFGGIEWSVTCMIPGGVDTPAVPVALSPKTYVDAYGKLHLGDEIEVGMVLTVNAKLVNRNPSGAGYELTASTPVTITIVPTEGFGNANHAERFPYITYQDLDSPTPASGAGLGESID